MHISTPDFAGRGVIRWVNDFTVTRLPETCSACLSCRVRPYASRFCQVLFAALIDDISPFKRGNEFGAIQKPPPNHLFKQFWNKKPPLLCRVLLRQLNTTGIWQPENSLHFPFKLTACEPYKIELITSIGVPFQIKSGCSGLGVVSKQTQRHRGCL